jgi:hypothetical protein
LAEVSEIFCLGSRPEAEAAFPLLALCLIWVPQTAKKDRDRFQEISSHCLVKGETPCFETHIVC